MEPCCLLLICCPPEVRRQKAIELMKARGLEGTAAEIAADALIEAVDMLLSKSPSELLRSAQDHGKKNKE